MLNIPRNKKFVRDGYYGNKNLPLYVEVGVQIEDGIFNSVIVEGKSRNRIIDKTKYGDMLFPEFEHFILKLDGGDWILGKARGNIRSYL